ncbi:MAG: ABC transporter ATP-binding protein, partial [Terriglobales bacterium]
MAAPHEEEVLGKAYDSRLMKRLLGYLRPYWWQTLIALTAIIFKALLDVVGPYLTKTAIDKYLVPGAKHTSLLDPWLSADALTGITQVAMLYVGALV